jgi:FSR family fosmidomycin resistance protein-like MFS transporter
MTGGELARTVGPVAAVGAVALLGLEGFWPVMAVGIAASVLLYFRFRRVDLAFHTAGNAIPLRTTFSDMRHVLLPLTVILAARSFMHGSMTAFLAVFLQQQGGSIWQGGAGLALFEAAGVAGVLTAGSLSDYLGRRRMLLISLVGAPLSVLLFLYGGGWLRIGGLLSCGFMILSTTPVMLAMVQEHAGNSPAAANGMFMMISFLARSSVVVLIGLIADRAGLHTAYLAGACAGLAGIPFVLMLPAGTK